MAKLEAWLELSVLLWCPCCFARWPMHACVARHMRIAERMLRM
jgi:hypothetical protein